MPIAQRPKSHICTLHVPHRRSERRKENGIAEEAVLEEQKEECTGGSVECHFSSSTIMTLVHSLGTICMKAGVRAVRIKGLR